MKEPFLKKDGSRNGLFCLWAFFLILSLSLTPIGIAFASDGATEALQMRHQAELAIAAERTAGHAKLANAMEQALPGLLQEYLATRDGTIALDTVDAAFVEERFKVARAMEEPGVALALDVFVGEGTGYEHGIQTAITKLADFQAKMEDRVSSAAVDAHERVMERQLEKIQEHIEKSELAGNLDSKLAKLDAKLDATIERLAEKQERRAEKAALKATVQEAKEELKETKQETKEAVKEAEEEAKEAKQEAKEAVKEAKAEAKETLKEVKAELKEEKGKK